MQFTKGNQFWKLRLTHGRGNKIESPEQLWQNFEEYSNWYEENPLIEVDYVGKDAREVNKPKMRAMTKDSFALACGLCAWEVISGYKKTSSEFVEVVTRIEKYIFDQKFTGASAGLLNPNIIARELGLRDASDITTNGETIKGSIIKYGDLEIEL